MAELSKRADHSKLGLPATLEAYDAAEYARLAARVSYDPTPFLRELEVPMLWIFGELDVNVPTARSVAVLEKLKRKTKRDITIKVFPGVGHSLMELARHHVGGLRARLLSPDHELGRTPGATQVRMGRGCNSPRGGRPTACCPATLSFFRSLWRPVGPRQEAPLADESCKRCAGSAARHLPAQCGAGIAPTRGFSRIRHDDPHHRPDLAGHSVSEIRALDEAGSVRRRDRRRRDYGADRGVLPDLRIDSEADGDRVIFGGMDHKPGQETNTADCLERLEATLLRILPETKIDHRWSGQVVETHDGLPLVGPSGERQFVATGFAGNGMTLGTLSGLMARDWVLKRENPWQQLFSVDRKQIPAGAWEYIRENLDYPYYYIKDWASRRRRRSTRSIKRGAADVLNLDGESVACFRDEQGKLHRVSAVCTHMGCLVRWNGAEKSWDCPCHGSRFRTDGSVLAGPAERPLEPMPAKQKAR